MRHRQCGGCSAGAGSEAASIDALLALVAALVHWSDASGRRAT
jgi:hypothetical protein